MTHEWYKKDTELGTEQVCKFCGFRIYDDKYNNASFSVFLHIIKKDTIPTCEEFRKAMQYEMERIPSNDHDWCLPDSGSYDFKCTKCNSSVTLDTTGCSTRYVFSYEDESEFFDDEFPGCNEVLMDKALR